MNILYKYRITQYIIIENLLLVIINLFYICLLWLFNILPHFIFYWLYNILFYDLNYLLAVIYKTEQIHEDDF